MAGQQESGSPRASRGGCGYSAVVTDMLAAFDTSTWSLAEWGAIAASYFLGAVPFGLVLARCLRGIDLREVGSGNIGATNTMRALGRGWGILAFFLDFAKGWAPVFLLAPFATPGPLDPLTLQVACGAAAVLGHCFPVYLGFKGGKGVSTAAGAMVAIDPVVFLVGGLVWIVTLRLSHFVGLASILMGVAFPIAAWSRHSEPVFMGGTSLLTLLILVRHRSNIANMLAGTEPRSGSKLESSESDSHG